MADTFPRRPTDEEKKELTEIAFPDKSWTDVDFSQVWLLAPVPVNDMEFNCYGWALLENYTIRISDKLAALNAFAVKNGYSPTDLGAPDAVIRVWGVSDQDVRHASRFCTKDMLKDYSERYGFGLKFDSPAAEGFPEETWTSKYGICSPFTTHPKDWLKGSCWGIALEDLKKD